MSKEPFSSLPLAPSVASTDQIIFIRPTGSTPAFVGYRGALGDISSVTFSLTGDVTGTSVAGVIATTIASGVVTNSKLANVATSTFKGRTTAGVGSPEDLTVTQATALLNVMTGDSGSGGLKGLVPTQATGDASKFLRGDGTWQTNAGGTVSSVALALPSSILTVSGSPVTTSGTLTGSLATQTANTVWAGPTSGGAGTPTFRSLVTADIPSAALTKTDDTNVTLTLGGTPATSLLAATSLTLGWTGTLAAGRLNSNVVQSVVNDTNITGSISAQALTLGWSGTLSGARGGTGVGNSGKTITLGGNLTTSGAFDSTFTMTNTTNVTFPTSGTLATTAGAPIPSIAQGDLLYGSASNVLSTLSKNASATRYLANTGSSNNPNWDQINLANGVTGTLPVGNGGTGTATAFTKGSVVFAGTSGVYAQDNSTFFYDATNHRLGVGLTTPAAQFDNYQSILSPTPGPANPVVKSTANGLGASGSNIFEGVVAGLFVAQDDVSVTTNTKGVLYGISAQVNPLLARNNVPYDDADGVTVQNIGAVKATDAIYVAVSSNVVGQGWLSGLTIDDSVDKGVAINGVANTHGLYIGTGSTSNYIGTKLGIGIAAKTPDSALMLSDNSTYIFTVTAANATASATYTYGGNTYTVVTTIAGGTSLSTTGTAPPYTASGTLTKATGTGDATISFSAVTSNLPAVISGTYQHIIGANATNPIILVDAVAGLSEIIGRRTNGTLASPTAVVANNNLLSIVGEGYDGTAYSANKVSVNLIAEENWVNGTNLGTYVSFETTASGSTTRSEKMRVPGAGGVILFGAATNQLAIKPAASGSNATITFPAGTTDFSATGGTSQVVKQTSSGGAFTVAQLSAVSDITGLAVTSGKTLTALKTMSLTAADDTGVYTFPTGTKTLIDTTVSTLASLATISTSTGCAVHGTNTNDSASAGYVGEIITASVVAGSAVSLTTNTTANITSISLTAGDWDVNGVGTFIGNTATVISYMATAISSTSATLPATFENTNVTLLPMFNTATFNLGQTFVNIPVGPYRISLASTTTIYLVANSTFTTNTESVYGTLRARRVR